MTVGQDFFTADSLGTVAGASVVIIVVTNTIRSVGKIDHMAVPFVVSLLVSFGVAAQAGKLEAWPDYAIAFFNACLLFCTATGAQETIVSGSKGKREGGAEDHSLRRRGPVKWTSSWLRPDPR
jgi:hypothetical protein